MRERLTQKKSGIKPDSARRWFLWTKKGFPSGLNGLRGYGSSVV